MWRLSVTCLNLEGTVFFFSEGNAPKFMASFLFSDTWEQMCYFFFSRLKLYQQNYQHKKVSHVKKNGEQEVYDVTFFCFWGQDQRTKSCYCAVCH